MSKKSIDKIVNWWESKRLFYNGLLILYYCLTYDSQGSTTVDVLNREIEFNNIFLGLIFLGSINLFYFLGSGFELTLRKYNVNIGKMNWVFLVMGCFIAIIQFEAIHSYPVCF